MSKLFALICAATLAALGAFAPAAAGAGSQAENAVYVPSAQARAVFQTVKSKPCCYNDGEYFQSSPSTCNRYGGRTVPFEYCERQYYQYQWNNNNWADKPCCRNNGQYFNASPNTCRRYGGRIVRQDRCDGFYGGQYQFNWNDNTNYNAEKPCCYNNGSYFNTTPKTCRKNGGQTVPMRFCMPRRNWR